MTARGGLQVALWILLGVAVGIGSLQLYEIASTREKTIAVLEHTRRLPKEVQAVSDLQLHYIGIGKSARDDGRVTVDLNGLRKPAVVVLASREKVVWQLQGALRHLKAIVLTPIETGSRVEGFPSELPVLGFAVGGLVMTHVLPECAPVGYRGRGCEDWSPRHGPLLVEIEEHLKDFSGLAMESVAAAELAEAFALPGQKLDERLRAALARRDAAIRKRFEEEEQVRRNRRAFSDRYRIEQQNALADLLVRYPPLVLKELTDQTMKVHAVSIMDGRSTRQSPRPSYLDYDEFKQFQQEDWPVITVRLHDETPAILLLLSQKAVRWRLEGPGLASVQGVYASSNGISIVENLPTSVALTIEAQDNGDVRRIQAPTRKRDGKTLEERVSERLPGLDIRYHELGSTNLVLIR